MNPHYLRGQLLQDQGRHSDAERELRLALMAAPDDARAMREEPFGPLALHPGGLGTVPAKPGIVVSNVIAWVSTTSMRPVPGVAVRSAK